MVAYSALLYWSSKCLFNFNYKFKFKASSWNANSRCFPNHVWNCHVVLWDSDIFPRGGHWPVPRCGRDDPGRTAMSSAARYSKIKSLLSNSHLSFSFERYFRLGVGYATMTIVFFLDVYYCIIIAWTLFYLISTFANIPSVPWRGCGWLND